VILFSSSLLSTNGTWRSPVATLRATEKRLEAEIENGRGLLVALGMGVAIAVCWYAGFFAYLCVLWFIYS